MINNLFKTNNKFIFILFAIYELIFVMFLKGKNVTIGVRSGVAKYKKNKKKQNETLRIKGGAA